MNTPQIRPLALCLFRNADKILVAEIHDPLKGPTFYRPLGGRIEYGEYAHQTIVREMQEELGAQVTGVHYLFTLENIFSYQGEIGHEIVLVHDGTLADSHLYNRETIQGREDDESAFTAVWKSLNDFEAGRQLLYPSGLLERLHGEGN